MTPEETGPARIVIDTSILIPILTHEPADGNRSVQS